MLVTCLWYLNCLETWLGSVEYFIETRLGLDKDNYSMKMFDFKMFWIANELIQREYDSFFFLFPFFGLVIIDLLFKNVKEARQGWLFYFWEKRRVAWLSSKPNTNVSLPVLQRIGKSIVIILRCGPLMPLYLPIELLFGCCQLAIAIGFAWNFKVFLLYSMNLVDEGIGHLPPPCERIDLLMPHFPLQWLDIQLPMQ